MPPGLRYLWATLVLLISLHYILAFAHEGYGRKTAFKNVFGMSDEYPMENNTSPSPEITAAHTPVTLVDDGTIILPQRGKADAVLVFLARNSDLAGVVNSVRRLEDRFNHKYHYPWVFLNDEEFTEEFKKRVRVLSYAKMEFGLIPSEHWNQPDWIDEEKATERRNQMLEQNVIYGGSVPYRNMCRFNSGFFYKHELLKPYRYYWRVEPDVNYFCDIDYDPFVYMQEHNKTYGFTLAMLEYVQTVPTLWNEVKEFVTQHPEYVAPHNALGFLSDNGGGDYNLCHFWSNFEIADLEFWRGEAYNAFFDYLDSTGGFYYERWGDAPVHSIAASLFLSKDQLHFFKDVGYQHDFFGHCPQGEDWKKGRCSCNPDDSFDYTIYSCLPRYERLFW